MEKVRQRHRTREEFRSCDSKPLAGAKQRSAREWTAFFPAGRRNKVKEITDYPPPNLVRPPKPVTIPAWSRKPNLLLKVQVHGPFPPLPPRERPAATFARTAVAIFVALLLLAAAVLSTRAAVSAADLSQAAAASAVLPPASERLDERQLASAINQYFERYWQAQGIEPAEAADDAEFLAAPISTWSARFPRSARCGRFQTTPIPTSGRCWSTALLQEGASATHFANVWRAAMLGGAADDQQVRALTPQLETWLALRFAANMPYDQLVRELLLSPLTLRVQPARQLVDGVADPTAFYQAVERKPAPLAAVTSRVFLGLQVQCAECHDHPHRHWKRMEFWSFASLFTNLRQRPMAGEDADSDGPSAIDVDDDDDENPADKAAGSAADKAAAAQPVGLKIPDTDLTAQPAFLDGTVPGAAVLQRPRVALVRWLTSRDNRWFAQAAANRLWEQLLGRGLVDPADDLENAGPNDHPELLEFIARQFEAHDYDVRYLIRSIAGSRLYQFSSRSGPSSSHQRHQFARMPLRRMTGEQLVDSLIQATGLREPPPQRNNPLANADSMRADLREKFSEANISRTEGETTILQALSLMNGKLITGAVDLAQGETLAAVVDSPFLDNPGKIEVLFLATLSRFPAPDEASQFVAYIDSGGPKHDRNAALADVAWALLNSAEFVLVH